MFSLPDSWVWDFWLVDDETRYHMFFLYASRALHDPEARHFRASVGHAVSEDLVTWTRVADALVRSDPPAYDDLATWTGSVVRHPDGRWFMFYTGSSLAPNGGTIQAIGYATSHDLVTWRKSPKPVLAADPRWYEKYEDHGGVGWHEEAFRDPWVFPDDSGTGWHMLITTRSNRGPAAHPTDMLDRAVMGYAWSPDLEHWELRAPLTEPGAGFGELEVFHTADVDGRPLLTFSCRSAKTTPEIQERGTNVGIWYLEIDSALGPFDVSRARPLTDDRCYVGKFIQKRHTGTTMFIAATNVVDGHFVGEIGDVRVAQWKGDDLVLTIPTASSADGHAQPGEPASSS